MLFTEWNWDTALAVRYDEGMAEGRAEAAELLRQEQERSRLLEEEIRRLRQQAGPRDSGQQA